MAVEALVAAILSDREVALNAGSDHGVQQGDVATIYHVTEVKDPETGDTIGRVRRSAVRLRIIETQPQLSVGQTFELARRAGTSGGLNLNIINAMENQEVVRVTRSIAASNWFTAYVDIGAEVSVEHPPAPAEDGS